MKQKRLFSYCLNCALSNKYLEVIIQCLELKIFNEKVEVLFYEIKKSNKTSILSLNNPISRHSMMNSKYLFDNAKSRLFS